LEHTFFGQLMLREHSLEKLTEGWLCSKCQWKWRSKPQSLCPGILRYDWGEVPLHLKTQTQLSKIGLKPTKEQPPAGCVYSHSKSDYYWLFDQRQAVPKRIATPAQLAALEQKRSLLNESTALAQESRGLLEPYKEGLIEVHPNNQRPYRWFLTTVHLPDGEAYQLSDASFFTTVAAIAYGKRVFDWIMANPNQIAYWGRYTRDQKDGGLGITLHRRQHFCYLPYCRGESELIVSHVLDNGEAKQAGWEEAVKVPYLIKDGILIVCDSCNEAIKAGWIPAWTIG
jgi:hypothetical protein